LLVWGRGGFEETRRLSTSQISCLTALIWPQEGPAAMQRDNYIRELSDDLLIVETNTRILQEVSCCEDWSDVEDVLHRHRDYYFRLAPRIREYLNNRIRDIMNER
jgi:hypothetical protein